MSKSFPARKLSLIAAGAALLSLLLPLHAVAQATFRLQPTEPLAEALDVARAVVSAPSAPAAKTLGIQGLVEALPSDLSGAAVAKEDEPGCGIDPASPSIGADVPLTYFGVPGPTLNPSLVGAVQLLTSGQLNTVRRTITIPLYRGRMMDTGEQVWFIATDTTDQVNAVALGINPSAKLAFAETGRGVRNAYLVGEELQFERGTVDFTPERQVVAGAEPNPFPPESFQPGSVGDEFYTPLAKVVNAGGHIYNVPIVAVGPASNLRLPGGSPNRATVHDSVVTIRPFAGTVTMELVAGFSFGRPVLYMSTDTNNPLAASLEAATFAPGLQDIDVGNDDSLFSAVERLFAFTNGQRGCDNPHRQGFNAAVSDGRGPFSILGGIPTIAPDYSPLWDVNLAEWTQEAIDLGYRARLIDEFQYLSFVDGGFLTGPGGSEFGSSGIIVNCPIVHRFL